MMNKMRWVIWYLFDKGWRVINVFYSWFITFQQNYIGDSIVKEEILQFNGLDCGEESIADGDILHTQLDDKQPADTAKDLLNGMDIPNKTVFKSLEDPQVSLL